MKRIFLTLLTIFSFSAFNAPLTYSTEAESIERIINPGYIYEHVLVGDAWWIFVYDEDHRLIDCYPEIND